MAASDVRFAKSGKKTVFSIFQTSPKTGAIVEISGAYFKNDNGLYFVQASPGDPSWCGSDYSLRRISKAGKISTAKYSLCFWPISVFISNRAKAAEARQWNREHAEIAVREITNMREVARYFMDKADLLRGQIEREIWDFGEDSQCVKTDREILAHYEEAARSAYSSAAQTKGDS